MSEHEVRVSLRLIDRVYGVGNYDDAADDMWYCLRRVSDHKDQFASSFDFDGESLVQTIQGLPEVRYQAFVRLLAEYKLVTK